MVRTADKDRRYGVPPLAVSHTSTRENPTGSWKYIRPSYRDRVAPCNEGCPVGIDIEAYMDLIREDRMAEALDLLLRENPMPSVTGRVCYHPCENACNRRSFDGAVSIHAVERHLGDLALELPLPRPPAHRVDQSVAVVGSGPGGLACAYHLARLGYSVTVFEAAEEPGGILRLGIPDYRLPPRILSAEIKRIEAVGVEIRCRTRVGKDVPWEALDVYDAVFVALGVHRSRPLGVSGDDDPGVRAGLAFLREVKFGGRPDLGKRVVVVGGGNTAMDCARTALRLGAKATVVYRRTRAEMPAIDEEVAEAEREGVAFRFLEAPVGVSRAEGRMLGLDCIRMRLGEVDASGRRRPVPVEGSEFLLPADTVLSAIGEAPEFDGFPGDVTHDDWSIATDGLGGTSLRGWFAGGDIIEGPHTVAHALGAGKRAAVGIDRYLRGERHEAVKTPPEAELRLGRLGNVSMTRWRGDDPVARHNATNDVVPFEDLNLEHFAPAPRHPDRETDPAGSLGFVEVNRGLTRQAARAEARRCFNCGVCNRCELCLIFCPDVAISRSADGTGFDIAYEYCKGCGICNAECPRGAMMMTREGL